MSKTKKFASLFLAMLMTLSCMAMTASAYGEEEHVHDEACCQEGAIARIPAMNCFNCGKPGVLHRFTDQDGVEWGYFTCSCGWSSDSFKL